MIKRVVLIVAAALGLLLVFGLTQFLVSGRPEDVPPKERYDILAHRGLHTNWIKGSYDRATGCEAKHMYPLTHETIENTIEAIGAAFELGATVVEIDIRRTADDQLVILHDYDLTCRTDGQGEVGDHDLAYLQSLDIGYGYTADGGQTYPLRGKGVGKMPTLEEVLGAFPDKQFLIDHKDGSLETADLLIEVIKGLPPEQQQLLYYWGPPPTRAYIQQEIPGLTAFFGTRGEVKDCFLPYILTLGLGGFPETCQGMGLGLPTGYVKYVPGWPYRFLDDVAEVGARFYLIIETEADARVYGGLPVDGVETDYIEIVGPVLGE